MTAMFIYESKDENIPADTDAYYEAVASQEEIYLEETEEELRMILTAEDSNQSETVRVALAKNRREQRLSCEIMRSMADANNDFGIAESLNEQLNHAAKELITGDSDDVPLSDEATGEMLQND
jgi:hypothetical protein